MSAWGEADSAQPHRERSLEVIASEHEACGIALRLATTAHQEVAISYFNVFILGLDWERKKKLAREKLRD
jgi:hypothetical protein